MLYIWCRLWNWFIRLAWWDIKGWKLYSDKGVYTKQIIDNNAVSEITCQTNYIGCEYSFKMTKNNIIAIGICNTDRNCMIIYCDIPAFCDINISRINTDKQTIICNGNTYRYDGITVKGISIIGNQQDNNLLSIRLYLPAEFI